MYDVIIIGAGPAGFAAAIYAARREMKTLIISKDIGGQVALASEIENYPGFKHIEAFDLIAKMQEQTSALGVQIINDEVKNIEKTAEGDFVLATSKEKYEAKTVIVAMGLIPRRLAIPGEKELAGKGVSYCANCDGPLFRGKTVAVVGGGNAALDAAEVLSKIASQVYLIHRSEQFRGFEALVDEVKAKDNIKIMLSSEIKEIAGEGKVQNIKVANSKDGATEELPADGVFIEIGRTASTDLVGEFTDRNEKAQIIVNDKCETKTPGLYAAGDVTNGEFKQITIAVGQGTIAALAAYQYLQLKQGKSTVVLDRGHK